MAQVVGNPGSGDSRRRAWPWVLAIIFAAAFFAATVAWVRAVLARQDLAGRLAIEGARLKREAEALRLERDAAEAAQGTTEGRLARDGFRSVAARQALERGRALAESGRVGEGLFWMARALEYSPPDDENLRRIIRMNLDAWPSWMARLEDDRSFQGDARLSPDAQVVAASEKGGPVRSFRVSDWQTFGPDLPTGTYPVAFSADGRHLLVGTRDGSRVQAWDTAAGTPAGPSIDLPEKWGFRSFSPDGSLIAAASDGEMRVIRVADGGDVGPPTTGLDAPVFVAFAPDGRRAVVTHRGEGRWITLTGKPSTGHPSDVTALKTTLPNRRVVFEPAGRYFAAWGGHWVFSTYDPHDMRLLRSYKPRSRVELTGLAVSRDGRRIASIDIDGWVQLWDESTGEEESPPFRVPRKTGSPQVYFGPDERELVILNENVAERWLLADRLAEGPPLPPMDRIDETPPIIESGDATWEARSLDRGSVSTVRLSPAAGGAKIELGGRILGTSGDGSLLMVLDRSQKPPVVRVHCFAGGVAVGLPLPHGNGCQRAAVSNDGARAATGEGRLLRLWDLGSGRAARPAIRKEAPISAMAYSPDGNLLIVGDDSGEVRLHDASDGTPVGGPIRLVAVGDFPFPVAVRRVAFDPDGRTFDAAGLGSGRRKRRTPRPMEGNAAAILRRVSALTGLEFDAADQIVQMDAERWRELRRSR
ncbi:WD40 repeat domain-containing protein [Paludisphaera soli]|uniref:WD40 repeat domain-containing protein n=1 Tax=Paludisphaera soli TaxID=2712865 RepID=UPI0013E9F87F|nr:WD40 repeat domain-containing protein [Paludisphaera soli]